MNISVIQPAALDITGQHIPSDEIQDRKIVVNSAPDTDDLAFKLGVWLSGLESFLHIRNHSFTDENQAKASSRDWKKEFRLTHLTILLCSRLTLQLQKALKDSTSEAAKEINSKISTEDVYKLSLALKDCVLLNEGLLRAAPLKFGEWTAWCNFLSDKLKAVEGFEKLILIAERIGEEAIPEGLEMLLRLKPIPFSTEADLRLVLPRFAKILKWLDIIKEMLDRDEPLKPTLLIFSRIYEQINEMISYINNRLLRYPNEEDALFGSLDGAAYTASIELRKVYNHELTGLSEIHITPSIYAKIEAAHSLLNDSFQLTLINFAELLDPEIKPGEIFPNIQEKIEQSIILRQEMWDILQDVRKAEQDPADFPLENLHNTLKEFLNIGLNYLFYKDREAVERFIEEVLITRNNKDLVPILHRFGAYLETLFGQINMRAVLGKIPFEYPPDSMPIDQEMAGGFF